MKKRKGHYFYVQFPDRRLSAQLLMSCHRSHFSRLVFIQSTILIPATIDLDPVLCVSPGGRHCLHHDCMSRPPFFFLKFSSCFYFSIIITSVMFSIRKKFLLVFSFFFFFMAACFWCFSTVVGHIVKDGNSYFLIRTHFSKGRELEHGPLF